MEPPSVEVYIAAFLARCDAARRAGQAILGTPGLQGLVQSGDPPRIRLLVTDDRAYDVLSAQLLDRRRREDRRVRGREAVCQAPRRSPSVARGDGDGNGLSRPANRTRGLAPARADDPTGAPVSAWEQEDRLRVGIAPAA